MQGQAKLLPKNCLCTRDTSTPGKVYRKFMRFLPEFATLPFSQTAPCFFSFDGNNNSGEDHLIAEFFGAEWKLYLPQFSNAMQLLENGVSAATSKPSTDVTARHNHVTECSLNCFLCFFVAAHSIAADPFGAERGRNLRPFGTPRDT